MCELLGSCRRAWNFRSTVGPNFCVATGLKLVDEKSLLNFAYSSLKADLLEWGRSFGLVKGLCSYQFDLNQLVEEFGWVFPCIVVLALAECLLLVSLIFMLLISWLLDEKKIKKNIKKANKNIKISQVIVNIRKYFYHSDFPTGKTQNWCLDNIVVELS